MYEVGGAGEIEGGKKRGWAGVKEGEEDGKGRRRV